MTTLDDVRAICAKFPGAIEGDGEQFSIGVLSKGKHKGFCWAWRERIDPKKARVTNERVLALRVPSLSAKEVILGSGEAGLFTEPHYDGYAAILIRLDEADPESLGFHLEQAWRCTASPALVAQFDEANG